MLLIKSKGINIDAKNNLGFTPLMKAALQGRTKSAKLLLFAGKYNIIFCTQCIVVNDKYFLTKSSTPFKKILMIGASATLTDPARSFRADQWARYCGRHQTAEMIETFTRSKLLDKASSNKWTQDSIPKSKMTPVLAPNGRFLQQQKTGHSMGNWEYN